MKEMVIRLPITENETVLDVEKLIISALKCFGDSYHPISSVEVDNERVFGFPEGFKRDFFNQ